MTLNSVKLHQSRVMIAAKPEVSIVYLLEAFRQLKRLQKKVHIVPVLITYDRVFEVAKISSEGLNPGKPLPRRNYNQLMSIRQVIRHINSGYPEKLGDITVRYLPALNVCEILVTHGFKDLTSANIEAAALALTTDLFKIEAFQQPLTLNSIVASIILYRREKSLPVADIAEDAEFLYEYIRDSESRRTTMNAKPTPALIEQHVVGLGFEMDRPG